MLRRLLAGFGWLSRLLFWGGALIFWAGIIEGVVRTNVSGMGGIGLFVFFAGGIAGSFHRWIQSLVDADDAERDAERFRALRPREVVGLNFSQTPEHALLDLNAWDALSTDQQTAAAKGIVAQLGGAWQLERLRRCEQGGVRHVVAFLRWNDASFALLPGGTFTLGYDPQAPYLPTAAELASFRQADDFYFLPDSQLPAAFESHLRRTLSPLREVHLGPFLIECEARLWENLDELEAMYALGFRPPTSDQWEYACGAGTRTLFRWGQECLSELPVENVTGMRAEHRRPNAFGLTIAHDPQLCEFCLEEHIARGGDLGESVAARNGAWHGWLTLATAYVGVAPPRPWPGKFRFRRTYPLT